jgi:hypothetical protein
VYELEQGGIRDEIYTFTAHSVNSSNYQGKAHLFSHFPGTLEISDHQQSWGYEDGPWKGLGPSLLVAADF